jgi:DNA-binding transcriptional LysR family regulator
MDHLDTMRVFIAVAEERGFSSASRRLALSPPSVTRAVAALEERVGARLLRRTTRSVRLTEAGTRFLADCKRILGEIEEAEASAAGAHAAPRGQLGVSAPVMFGRLFVAPVLLDFLERHPQVTAQTLLVDRIVDLMDEGLDVAIRIADLADSSLSAVRVGWMRRVVCASPAYLAARGMPRVPADLSRHDAIAFSSSAAQSDWPFLSGGRTVTARPPAQLIANTAEVAVAAAVAGRGVTRVLGYQIAAELTSGQLQIVLPDFERPPLPIHVVHLEGRRAVVRVRAFVDFAVDRLRADPRLQG